MNILEDQVTDLNYLATSPIAVLGSIDMSVQQQRQSSNASTASPADTGNVVNDANAKRKAEGEANTNGAPQTRAKRTRYISIACNECKRRKIKCNGNTPCQRCGNLKLECQYAPNCCSSSFKESEEFKQMNAKLVSLQEQVDNLYANLNSLRAAGEEMAYQNLSERSMSMSQPPAPSMSPLHRYRTGPRTPQFRGPTSSAFNLDVAKNTLNNMGYTGLADAPDDGVNTQDVTPQGSPPRMLPPLIMNGKPNGRDPIWQFTKEEMVRLCRAYEDEMGLMHPILNIDRLILHGKNLFDFMDAALRSGLANPNAQNKGVNDRQTCILKMILAIMCLLEGDGQSELAYQLYDNVKKAGDDAMHAESVDIRTLPLIALVAIFHFFSDEEALAWRIIGQAARMCIELGLHRRDSLFRMFPDEEERADALRLFWAIYVLDRRWSFGTGLPFALQDADIDPTLPEPVHKVPYLNSMITYSRIGSKVWRSVGALSGHPNPILNIEEINYLDYQVVQWQKALPPSLQLPTLASPETSSRSIHRLQILLYLRANQMRIHIYRPVLHSASSIQEHPSYANTVVELAKDSIRALTHLNQTTDIYTTQKVCFNYFLISALAVLFLASCHAPVQFSAVCRDEFYMALDLIKGFSNKSYVSKRLWKTIKGLKAIAPKLGLSQEGIHLNGGVNGTPASGVAGVDPEDPHSSAALAMAGLAGHEISSLGGTPGFGNAQQPPHQTASHAMTNGSNNGKGNSPMNGFQMSHEMTSLFEAALGSVGVNGSASGNGEYVGITGDGDFSGIGSNVFGGDEELYRQLRDLF
ncbi:fungal-specific transcription factor domain protein [Xylogone sp. PMI_703]|nr:fungal-specific transcription factor domain protein [Xylogone sp. PMI_703]